VVAEEEDMEVAAVVDMLVVEVEASVAEEEAVVEVAAEILVERGRHLT